MDKFKKQLAAYVAECVKWQVPYENDLLKGQRLELEKALKALSKQKAQPEVEQVEPNLQAPTEEIKVEAQPLPKPE